MSDERKKIGSIGEKLAADYLERIGYSILLHPSLSVTKAKGKRIRELAGLYLMEHEDETRQPRFDVISVIMNQNHEGTIEHLENAF